MKIVGRKTMFTYAGAASKFGMTWDQATPSDARHTTPATTKTTSATQSFGQPIPKNTRPASTTSVIWTAAFVTALAAIPVRYAPLGSGVPRMRFRTPCSRRNVRFIASALNVVDITLIPAMPGTMTFSVFWSPPKIAPNSARNRSGRKKLKNAAEGLRQNIRRSRRYWCQARTAESGTGSRLLRFGLGLGLGRELEVDVLERRPRHGQVAQRRAAGERRARELVQQRRRVLGLPRHDLAALVAPRHAVARRAGAERRRRSLGDEPPLLDDRDAVAERLRLVEVVRRQEHRLSEVLQRAHDVPRRAPRRRVEARRRLVEEDQLGVADEREREVEAAQLAAAQRARVRVGLVPQPREVEDLVNVARGGVEACPMGDRLAHRDVPVHARALEHDAHALAQLVGPLLRVVAEHGHDPARARAVALEDLHRGRLARPVRAEQPEDLARRDLEVDTAHGVMVAVALVQVADEDGRCGGAHHGR